MRCGRALGNGNKVNKFEVFEVTFPGLENNEVSCQEQVSELKKFRDYLYSYTPVGDAYLRAPVRPASLGGSRKWFMSLTFNADVARFLVPVHGPCTCPRLQ